MILSYRTPSPNRDLHVVSGNAHLFGDFQRGFFKAVMVMHDVYERRENVEAGVFHFVKAADQLHDECTLLRNHDNTFCQNNKDQNDKGKGDDDASMVIGSSGEWLFWFYDKGKPIA